MRKNPWCSIAPKPTGVRPHSLSPLSNCGSSNSYTRRRGPPYGIQSIYFRTGVKDVLARFGHERATSTSSAMTTNRQGRYQEVAVGTVIQSKAQSKDDRTPRWSRTQRAALFEQSLHLQA